MINQFWLISHIISYNPVSRKKDKTSSILTFSNYSVRLVTLKNRFLMTAKALHSIRMCLIVHVVWHVKHCGCGSCFTIKAWVSLVCSLRNRAFIYGNISIYNSPFLSFRVFGLLFSSLLLYSQRFGRYVLRHSLGVCWTREPTWNFEPRPLFNLR